jgi:hypothetical protein
MIQQFKNLKDFNHFCDTSMICVCGRLMTGLHMSGCRKLAKIRLELMEKEQNNPRPDRAGKGERCQI